MIRRFILSTVAIALSYTSVFAVPAKRGLTKSFTLADGSVVEASLCGDENVHYWQTADGRCLQLSQEGGSYNVVDGDSLLRQWSERLQTASAARRAKAERRSENSYVGTRRGLVILVNFPDLTFATPQTEWDNFFNEQGYSTAGMIGSVHDYFYEQSYGQFDLEFDVVGPVTVSKSYSYYGSGTEDNVPIMVKEACELADGEVNFADYDWDGDGYVDQVFVVYAGYGEAQGADEATIWPHEWNLSAVTSSPLLDGVRVDTYACSSELHGDGITDTGVVDGIGTACHEFAHCLGLPDFYDTSADATNYGMDVWSLLDYGSYNGDGYIPAAFTAYERNFCGWLQYTELSSTTYVTGMPSLTDEPLAYVVYNDADENEYYLLQNIQQTGFNSAALGHGLLIMHVDYNASAWANNTLNNTASHQRMTIFAADNRYGAYGANANGDPFPGVSGNTSFTDETTPASTLYNANLSGTYFMGKPIEDITETADGFVSFSFMPSAVAVGVPKAVSASDVDEESGIFTANWTAVSGATQYQVMLSETVAEDTPWDHSLIAEDFQGCYSSEYGTSDVSADLDTYLTSAPGWTGNRLYLTPYQLEVAKGTMAKPGYIQTPLLSIPTGDDVTICLAISFGDARTGSARIYVETADGVASMQAFSGESGYYTFGIYGYPYSSFYVGLYSVSDTYMYGLYVFDGDYEFSSYESGLNAPELQGASSPLSCVRLPSMSLVASADNRLAASSSSSTTTNVALVTTTATSYTFTGLDRAVYSYKVRAVTADGVGSWSNTVNVDLSGANRVNAVPERQTTDSAAIYDLSGRLLLAPHSRGIYIKDGKKRLAR
ncbi:MAG: M6 family metalloprotease domain-containing protein [Prevotellaceae bacterium]|nr:M6 family metalloprotease domain-containing protein [Prevotellaceae bacterium]